MMASQSSKKPRKPNAWNQHLKKIRQEHPDLSLKQANDLAKKTYKKGETNVTHKSHSSVDLSRHDGRIVGNEKTGTSGSSNQNGVSTPGETHGLEKDSASGTKTSGFITPLLPEYFLLRR